MIARRQPIFIALLLLVTSLLIVYGWFVLHEPDRFPFKTIKIIGSLPHVSKHRIKQTVRPFIEEGFFNLQPGLLRQRLRSLPWVAEVELRRKWPDGLEISIREQHPVARFGVHALINAKGELFQPEIPLEAAELPFLQAKPEDAKEVLAAYRNLQQKLAQLGLVISRLSKDPENGWQVELRSGPKLQLGREALDQRIERFVRAYPHVLAQRGEVAQSVDLRYPNGMAVRWQGDKRS